MTDAICWAYTDDGVICKQPAIGIDYDNGCPVCAEHLDAYLTKHEEKTAPRDLAREA